MKYAIVRIDGKQLKIQEGETLKVNRQNSPSMEALAYSDDDNVLIGTPVLSDVKIKFNVLGEEMSKKIRVGRFKSKSRYHKVKGHRQLLSLIKIEEISLQKEVKEKKEPEAKAPVEKPKKEKTAKSVKKETKSKVSKTTSSRKSKTSSSKKGKEKA
jgi:large subunit ribosomal protein L21